MIKYVFISLRKLSKDNFKIKEETNEQTINKNGFQNRVIKYVFISLREVNKDDFKDKGGNE